MCGKEWCTTRRSILYKYTLLYSNTTPTLGSNLFDTSLPTCGNSDGVEGMPQSVVQDIGSLP